MRKYLMFFLIDQSKIIFVIRDILKIFFLMRIMLSVYYFKILKYSAIFLSTTSASLLLFETYRTRKKLNSLLRTNVLECERKRADYIFINDPNLKEHLIEIYGEGDEFSQEPGLKKNGFEMPSFTKWWKNIKNNYALRLMHLAHTGTKFDRIRAIRLLSNMTYLQDWDYRYLAQQCDALTAVGLARSQICDFRWFLDPPFRHRTLEPRRLIHELRLLLIALGPHPCMQSFLNKMFHDFHEFGDSYDNSIEYVPGTPLFSHVQDAMKLCVDALVHFSVRPGKAKELVQNGALQLLIDVARHSKSNTEIKSNIAEILSNIAIYGDSLDLVYCSGWIGILHQWSIDEDVRLRVCASRALVNFDKDDLVGSYTYPARVFPLYPVKRCTRRPKLDVVFVHGLLGGVFITWRQRDIKDEALGLVESMTCGGICNDVQKREVSVPPPKQELNFPNEPYSFCWPMDWLPKDFEDIRIIGVNYDTSLSLWMGTSCNCYSSTGPTLEGRAHDLMHRLVQAGVGMDGRKVVWVAHSMGGLLVKSMIVQSHESQVEELKSLYKSTTGIAFLGTPHDGSSIAALPAPTAALLWPSIEVKELREKSPKLRELHQRFLQVLEDHKVEVVTVCEGKPTLLTALKVPLVFVAPQSADPGVGDFYTAPSNHLDICKPTSRQSFLYKRLMGVIKNSLTIEEH